MRRSKLAILIAGVLVLTVSALAWMGWRSLKLRVLPIPPEAEAPRVDARQPVYLAIFGVDERKDKDDPGRSDTLMLLRLASQSETAVLINIPRDTRAKLPNGETGKINAAYPLSGPEGVTRTVADLLDIPQPYYVKLNLQAFERIVDRLGGVDLHVDRHYVYHDPDQNLHIDLPAGLQHLNGAKALQFVRLRYDGMTNSDLARIKRQQQFLAAMGQKLTSPAYWHQLPEILGVLRTNVATNVPEGDQLALAQVLFKARGNLQMQTLPGEPDDATGDWIMDVARWNEVVNRWPQS